VTVYVVMTDSIIQNPQVEAIFSTRELAEEFSSKFVANQYNSGATIHVGEIDKPESVRFVHPDDD